MSEAAAAGAASNAAATAAGNPGNSTAPGAKPAPGSGNNPGTNARAGAQSGAQNQSRESQTPNDQGGGAADDGLEEVSLGSVKGRIPKDLAKAIKEFERGTQEKFRDVASLRKGAQRAQYLEQLAKQDPERFFKEVGGDFYSIAEERLAKKYERDLLAKERPELVQLEDTKAELQRVRQAELAAKSDVMEQIKDLMGADAPEGMENQPRPVLEKFLAHQKQQYETLQSNTSREMIEAWQETGLPKHPYFGALMSFQMLSHSRKTNSALPAREAAAKVKSDFEKMHREVLAEKAKDPKGILEFLGEDILKVVRQADIARVTAEAASQVGNKGPAQAASQAPKKPMNEHEFREFMSRS